MEDHDKKLMENAKVLLLAIIMKNPESYVTYQNL